jgi:oligopeptide/dipeptide ABC transporter ATP-binding protein
LLRSIPKIGEHLTPLDPIRGMVPSPFQRPQGCPFHTRCDHQIKGLCNQVLPETVAINEHHETRCLIYDPSYQDNFALKEMNYG